jgi:DNA-binding transcriptional LysR family regulator
MEALSRETVDVAVGPNVPAVTQQYSSEFLGEFELGFMMSVNHPAASKDSVTFSDFETDRILVRNPSAVGPSYLSVIIEGFRNAGIEPNIVDQRVYARELVGYLVANGLGVKAGFARPTPGTVFRRLSPPLLVSYVAAWPSRIDGEPIVEALRDQIRALRGDFRLGFAMDDASAVTASEDSPIGTRTESRTVARELV